MYHIPMWVMQNWHEPKLYWSIVCLCAEHFFLILKFFFLLKESNQHFYIVGLEDKSSEYGECWPSQDNIILLFKRYSFTVHFHSDTGQIGSSKGMLSSRMLLTWEAHRELGF